MSEISPINSLSLEHHLIFLRFWQTIKRYDTEKAIPRIFPPPTVSIWKLLDQAYKKVKEAQNSGLDALNQLADNEEFKQWLTTIISFYANYYNFDFLTSPFHFTPKSNSSSSTQNVATDVLTDVAAIAKTVPETVTDVVTEVHAEIVSEPDRIYKRLNRKKQEKK